MKKMKYSDYLRSSDASFREGMTFPTYTTRVTLEFTHEVQNEFEIDELHNVVTKFKKNLEETFYDVSTRDSLTVASKII